MQFPFSGHPWEALSKEVITNGLFHNQQPLPCSPYDKGFYILFRTANEFGTCKVNLNVWYIGIMKRHKIDYTQVDKIVLFSTFIAKHNVPTYRLKYINHIFFFSFCQHCKLKFQVQGIPVRSSLLSWATF